MYKIGDRVKSVSGTEGVILETYANGSFKLVWSDTLLEDTFEDYWASLFTIVM